MTSLDRDVEVAMPAGLAAHQRVDSPAAVDPQPRTHLIGQAEDKEDIVKRGLRSRRGTARHEESMRAYRPGSTPLRRHAVERYAAEEHA
ncbi:hypothetical protein Ait01nite_097430 [Actinoplanes italicus]|nr:hypothetical protein Ait01nite_097430 [Actinoplanes italicus]